MIRYLIDTNLLLYPFDVRDPRKRERAGAVLRVLARKGNAALSAQVLGEFASVALRKLRPPLPPAKVRGQVELLSRAFPVFSLFYPVVVEALRGVERYRLSYFDAQLWALARLRGIPVILSEDFTPGSVLDGVRFLNPLEPDFDLRKL